MIKTTNNLDFYELTVNLENLLARISVIKSSYSWNKYCKIFSGATQDNIYSSLDTIHHNVLAYIYQLQQFTENPNYRLSSQDVEKFLNNEILEIRKRAIDSLAYLSMKANYTTDDVEKELLQEIVTNLRIAVNNYLAIVRDIIQHNPKMQAISRMFGYNYIEKYELNDI